MQFYIFAILINTLNYFLSLKLKSKSRLKEKNKQSYNTFSPFQNKNNIGFNSQEQSNSDCIFLVSQ